MKLKEVLAEAKMKMADLKKSQAEKIKEEKSSTGGEITRSKGVTKHKENPNRYSDEEHGEVASNVKSKSAADKKKEAPAQKQSPKSAKTWGMKNSEKFDNRDKELEENMEPCSHCGGEGHVPKAPVKVHPSHAGKVAKYSRLKDAVTAIMNDKNKNGIDDRDEGLAEAADEKCNHSAKGKKCPVHGLKECSGMYEAQKTMSRAAKGHEKYGKEGMAALAKAGKEGKSLEPVKAKYNKYDEGSMPMKKVGGKSVPAFAADGKGKNDLEKKKVKEAAAMWNSIKETTAYVAEKAQVEKKAKHDYDNDGNIETGSEEHAGSVDNAIKASKAKETVKESADMTRLRELTKHLLG